MRYADLDHYLGRRTSAPAPPLGSNGSDGRRWTDMNSYVTSTTVERRCPNKIAVTYGRTDVLVYDDADGVITLACSNDQVSAWPRATRVVWQAYLPDEMGVRVAPEPAGWGAPSPWVITDPVRGREIRFTPPSMRFSEPAPYDGPDDDEYDGDDD